jgi:hypothetical protein
MDKPAPLVFRYRKLPGAIHQWHNNPFCPEWPNEGFLLHEGMPDSKTICPTCTSMNEIEEELAHEAKTKK